MYYLVLIFMILFYLNKVDLNNCDRKEFIKKYSFIFILMFFTFAFQYKVGTDYKSYLAAGVNDELGQFKLMQFVNDGELLFAGIVKIAQLIHYPQMIFILTALVQNIVFFFTLYYLKQKNINMRDVIFMYFCLSLCFFNQFNGIRQFIAINIFILAVLYMIDSKMINGILLIILASFFHSSAKYLVIFALIIWLCRNKCIITKRMLFIISLCLVLLYLIDINGVISIILEKMNIYTEYIGHNYVQKMSISGILTKVVKLVVVFYSIYRLETDKLNSFEKNLLQFSYLTIFIMILSFSSTIIWRVYLYFDFFIIFPVILFYKYNAIKKEKRAIELYLFAFLFAKIILFPKGEYLYRNVFWR